MKIEKRAWYFLMALSDVYRDEDSRELRSLDKLQCGEPNEDITAILLAFMTFVKAVTSWDGDMIDFVNLLTKIAFQHLLEKGVEFNEEV